MEFKPIEYMEWIKKRPRVKYDFCRSGVEDVSLKDLDMEALDLEIFGENSYGYPPLSLAVSHRYGVGEENVMLALGTSHALFMICAALIEDGDEVLVEKPAYEPLKAVPRAFGARVKRFERRFDTGYEIEIDAFEKELGSKTKMVFVTNLHNPSGAKISSSILKEMAAKIREQNAVLVVDEIYLEFLENESAQTSFGLEDNIVSISSLTKVFGLGDLRCGWILASTELVEKMNIIQDYSHVEGVFIGECISSKVFGQLEALRKKREEHIQKNLNLISQHIEGNSQLTWVKPAGGVICFPRVGKGLSGDELAGILREEFDVAVVPGSLFEDSRHFRLGFDAPTENLAFALESIEEILLRY